MAEYKLTVYGFDSGLNELLNGVYYDWKTKRVYNRVKNKNDALIVKHLRYCDFRNVKLKTPIEISYKFYCKDKRHDRMNIASAADKSFQDALQKVGMLNNDGWDEVVGIYFDWVIDKLNPRIEIVITELDTTSKLGESQQKDSKTDNLFK